MKFAHLVEINDPLTPWLDTLSRAQLWRGLVRRAESPQEFIPWLDRCTVSAKTDTTLARVSHYGDLVVRDEVIFLPPRQVIYNVPAQKDIPASMLTMTIEEPEPGILFVRFEYEAGASAESDTMDEFYNEFRRSAYQEADIDTIRTIRQMAEEGKLGE